MREATLGLMALSVVFAFFSYYLNKTLGKRDEVRATQQKFNDHMKAMQDALKRNDEAKIKELQKRDKELNDAMMQTMFLPFRSLIVILPIYFALYSYILPALFPNFSITLPFSLPGRMDLWNPSAWRPTFGARGFFIWSTVFAGLLVVELLWTKVEARVLAKLFKGFQPKTNSSNPNSPKPDLQKPDSGNDSQEKQ